MPGRAVYLIIGAIAALGRMIGFMRRTDFHFELPQELIAQRPTETRSASRMLVLDGADGSRRDLQFRDFPSLLQSADVLVFNDTRVIPARVFGTKESGGRVHILLRRALTAATAPSSRCGWTTSRATRCMRNTWRCPRPPAMRSMPRARPADASLPWARRW